MTQSQMAINPIAQSHHQAKNSLMIRYWLYFICILVAAMVVVGGATRLTDSGLSITQWKPLLGIFPPFSSGDWLAEFERYKQIPQYIKLNSHMSLSEFKFIYWWEWSHRFLGRVIGLVFIIPMIYFYVTKRLGPGLGSRLLFLLFLGGAQGFIGWWMVSSGLVERTDVSQYRLAIHLVLACIIFAYAMWLARNLHSQTRQIPQMSIQILAPIIVLVIFLQIFLGALVAGLDAGLAFNDWPLMDGAIIPESLFVMEPWWLNVFENSKLVQFVHRLGGYVLVILIVINFLVSLGAANSPIYKRSAIILVIVVLAQAILGIVTLVLHVPLKWALFHQAGAILLLGFAVSNWATINGGNKKLKKQMG